MTDLSSLSVADHNVMHGWYLAWRLHHWRR